MKKINAYVSALFLATAVSVCGCAGKDVQPHNANSNGKDTVSTDVDKVDGADNSGENVATQSRNDDLAEASEKAYQDFLDKKATVSFDDDRGYIFYGKDFYIYDLVNSCTNYSRSSTDTVVRSTEIKEKRIDIGNDGVPELALGISNMTDNMGAVDYVFIIKYVDEELKVLSTENGAYRSYCFINKDGIVVNGGSSGASTYGEGYDYISPDGKEVLHYSFEIENCAQEAIIPWYYIENCPEDYPMDFNYESFDVVVKTYSIGRWEDAVRYFVFEDQEGNSIPCVSGYEELYAQNNLHVVTQAEFEEIIKEELKRVDGKYESANAEELTWNTLDISEYENIYGTDWVSAYKNFIGNPCNYRELLVEQYEIMYGYDPIGISGFTIADLNSDDVPELIVLLKDFLSDNSEPMMIYSFDKDTCQIERKSFVVSYGSEIGKYVTEYFSMPEESFTYRVANDCYSYAGVVDGKFIVFSNFGDGYANYEINEYDIDADSFTNVFNEWYTLEGSRELGASGDEAEAQRILDSIDFLYFVDITDENIEKYISDNYTGNDINHKTGEEVSDMLSRYTERLFEISDSDIWYDGPVDDNEYLGYSFDAMIQGWEY